MGLQYLLLHLFWLATTVEALASQPPGTTRPGCPDKCGNVSIPYPFGIGDSCTIRGGGFNISCNTTFNPPKPFWGDLEVLDITLLSGLMRILSYIGYRCYTNTGKLDLVGENWMNLDERQQFAFSETHNKLTAIGCDTIASITGSWGRDFKSGCMSFCNDRNSVINGSCSGIGCCQTAIPNAFKSFEVTLDSVSNHKNVSSFNPCSYAFLVEQDAFSFNELDLIGSNFLHRSEFVPVVLDWAIANETCEMARKDSASFACVSENSTCYESTNGYRCNCSEGYEGNPYLIGGCQDIDECKENDVKKLCEQNCTNLPGNYSCSCRKGYHGLYDDQRECIKDPHKFPAVAVVLGIGLSLLVIIIGSSSSYWVWRKRKLIKLKEKFFQQNGGLLLQEKISSGQSSTQTFKIFTVEELKKATNNYDKSQIVGQGGSGTVYKGILPDNKIVAVKKSKIVDETQIEQFINEVHVLSQINHRNIVKLLGCCLEAEVPILVYEFISNGTLSQHIHGEGYEGYASSISLENRLRIAAETAGALYYLHSATSTPIFHRDVKSANILLDNNFMAKVSDFGASRLVPLDHTRITTLVMGTWGYLDPEYHQTGQLTGKSDVYSFGVVLVELLTGEGPISSTRSQDNRSLSNYFLTSMKENRLFEILEERVQNEGEEEQLMSIAQLAKRCLKLKGEERPTMKEVVVELEGLRRFHEHPWEPKKHEETENLLGEPGPSQGYTSNATCEYSVDSRTLSALEIGR